MARLAELLSVLHQEGRPADRLAAVLEYYLPLMREAYPYYYPSGERDLEHFQTLTERYRSLESMLADMALGTRPTIQLARCYRWPQRRGWLRSARSTQPRFGVEGGFYHLGCRRTFSGTAERRSRIVGRRTPFDVRGRHPRAR